MTTSQRAPGIDIRHVPALARPLGLARGDIAAFLGYTPQGPSGFPVQLESWRSFVEQFGEPYAFGHLGAAIKGFFENGGQRCYLSRLTGTSAQTAHCELQARSRPGLEDVAAGQRWMIRAAWKNTDPDALDRRLLRHAQSAPETLDAPLVLDNPGAWGNRLSLTLEDSRRSVTRFFPDPEDRGLSGRVDSLDGIEPGSLLRLTPIDAEEPRICLPVAQIDARRSHLHWPVALADALDEQGMPAHAPLDRPYQLEVIDLSLQLWLDGRLLEDFRHLGLHPDHRRYWVETLRRESRYLRIETIIDTVAQTHLDTLGIYRHTRPETWPTRVAQWPLHGGHDGLASLRTTDYTHALAALNVLPDIALLCAPDLVLNATPDTPEPGITPAPHDCQELRAPAPGQVLGRVLLAGHATAQPVAGVRVQSAHGRLALTDRQGHFRLTELPAQLQTLWFDKPGFIAMEVLALATAHTPREPVVFAISELNLPPAFDEAEILQVQQAMLNPAQVGPYRIALLDPPSPDMTIQAVQGWRARFDSARAVLYYPWLRTEPLNRGTLGLRATPPCGHLAGLIALSEAQSGIHRAPANLTLRACKGLTLGIDETRHGQLNALGINVLRQLDGRGIRIMGARTLSSDTDWHYLNVRRLVDALERTLEQQLQWAVFEPHSLTLRQAVRFSLLNLMGRLWRQGALLGATADQAFSVKCDEDNNPAAQRDQGRFLAEIRLAPSVPCEFISVRLGRTLDALDIQEL